MFSLAILALASITFSANALVIPRSDTIPPGYAEGYLEHYATYNTRYMALGCNDKHNTQFFTDCCHPMLATENLRDNRKPYCTPSQQALASAAQDPDPSTVTPNAPFPTPPPASATPSPTTATPKNVAPTTAPPPPKNVSPPPPPPPPPAPSKTPPPPSPGLSGNGIATFFYQNGIAGACGKVHSDSDLVVALQTDIYANGEHCGKQVQLTNTDTGVTVTATVADECPTCNPQSIDLSTGLFSKFASFDQGTFNLHWSLQ